MRRFPWARLVSNILSPPVIWAVLAFPIAFREAASQEQALLWAFTYIVMVCGVPALYIGLMVWRGKITDLHMQVRAQRIRPFLVSLVGTALAWGILRLMGAPPILPSFALVSFVLLSTMLLITLVWQISMHTMSITCAVVAVGALYGLGAALLLSPLIALVSIARLKLRRHTVAEVVGGGILGGGVTLLMLLILNPVP
jgi:hypothetical protein